MNPTEHVVERPPFAAYEDLSRRMHHLLLRPDLNDEQVADGCRTAAACQAASVIVRPSDVEQAVRYLQSSETRVGTVVGYPHGANTTPAKIYEANDALKRGARSIDVVLNIGKTISRQFQYVETEILQLSDICHRSGATLNVIFETGYLAEDLQVIACRIAKRCGVDYIQTSAGAATQDASIDHLRLLFKYSSGRVQVRAADSLDSLAEVLEAYESGADSFASASAPRILDEWKAKLAAAAEKLKDGTAPPPVIS